MKWIATVFCGIHAKSKLVYKAPPSMKKILVLFCLVISTQSWSQVMHQAPANVVIPQNFSVGTQYYDLNVDGLRQYVDNNGVQDMKSDLEVLEKQQRAADITQWSMVAAGAVLAVGSFTFLQLDYENIDGEKKKIWNSAAFVGGALVGVGGFWVARWVGPGREDYLQFINKHNANPDREPLKLNLGWNLEMSQPNVLVQLSF